MAKSLSGGPGQKVVAHGLQLCQCLGNVFCFVGGTGTPFTHWLWLRSSSCHFVGNFSVTDSLVVHFVWLSFPHEVIIFLRLWPGKAGRRWSFCGWWSARNFNFNVSIYLTIQLSNYPTVSEMFVLPRFVPFCLYFFFVSFPWLGIFICCRARRVTLTGLSQRSSSAIWFP